MLALLHPTPLSLHSVGDLLTRSTIHYTLHATRSDVVDAAPHDVGNKVLS